MRRLPDLKAPTEDRRGILWVSSILVATDTIPSGELALLPLVACERELSSMPSMVTVSRTMGYCPSLDKLSLLMTVRGSMLGTFRGSEWRLPTTVCCWGTDRVLVVESQPSSLLSSSLAARGSSTEGMDGVRALAGDVGSGGSSLSLSCHRTRLFRRFFIMEAERSVPSQLCHAPKRGHTTNSMKPGGGGGRGQLWCRGVLSSCATGSTQGMFFTNQH